MPTDLDQSTGLERLEILGKMQGIDVFDMRPLDASRKGMASLLLDLVSWIVHFEFQWMEKQTGEKAEHICSMGDTGRPGACHYIGPPGFVVPSFLGAFNSTLT